MKKDVEKIIEIPEGVEVLMDGARITVKSDGKEISREFDFPFAEIEKKDSQIEIRCKKATKRELKLLGTMEAHLKNMILGIKEGFEYRLEICNVHFPMNVKAENDKVIIKSFLGEKTDRFAKILPNVSVDVKGTEVTVSSYDREAAGQTAANIEKATRLKGRDRRIFQDGIFITNKCGREL